MINNNIVVVEEEEEKNFEEKPGLLKLSATRVLESKSELFVS